MPLRPEDARFAAAVDLLLLEERTRVGLILREEECLYALVGEKLHWLETAEAALRRAFQEELGLPEPTAAVGILGWRPAGIVGPFTHPDRDPRFLRRKPRAQVLSLPYLVEVRFETLLQHVRPGPSVVELQVFSLTALPPLFLDHLMILQRVLRAEKEGQLPLLC